MKTGLEHFMLFGPKLAKLCIEASRESKRDYNLDTEVRKPQDAVMDCIIWSATKEGSVFWNGFICAFTDLYQDADGGRARGSDKWNKGHELGKKAKMNHENNSRAFS